MKMVQLGQVEMVVPELVEMSDEALFDWCADKVTTVYEHEGTHSPALVCISRSGDLVLISIAPLLDGTEDNKRVVAALVTKTYHMEHARAVGLIVEAWASDDPGCVPSQDPNRFEVVGLELYFPQGAVGLHRLWKIVRGPSSTVRLEVAPEFKDTVSRFDPRPGRSQEFKEECKLNAVLASPVNKMPC